MKTNKKLLASAMALGLAALTTVGSTYAWFATSSTATLNGIEITAKSDLEGIYIATETSTKWGEEINLGWTEKLAPVTTADAVDFYCLDGKGWAKATATEMAADGKFYGVTGVTEDKDYFTYLELGAIEHDDAEHVSYVKKDDTIYYAERNILVAVNKDTDKINMNVKPTTSSDDVALKASRMVVKVNGGDATIVTLKKHDEGQADVALSSFNSLKGSSIVVDDKHVGTPVTADADFLRDEWTEGKTVLNSTDLKNTFDGAFNATLQRYLDTNHKLNQDAANPEDNQFKYALLTIGFYFEGNDLLCRNELADKNFGVELTFLTAAA